MTVASPRPRPARRAPTDLPFQFADRALAEALAAERAEPDWLRTERLEAAAAFEALPIEPNQLYTTYLDLRHAELADARPYIQTASVPNAIASAKLPDGVAGLIDLREDGVAGLVLEPAAAAGWGTVQALGAGPVCETRGI